MTPEQLAEIAEHRRHSEPTLRVVSRGLEEHLYLPHRVLDHGFIRVVDYMGDQSSVVQAARVSYGAGTKTPSDDRGLLRYLMRHRHSTPFEMCEVKLHVKLPVFVARQWIRHRMANVNEYSARYSILDREFYVPTAEHIAPQSASNKQGRGDAYGDLQVLDDIRSTLHVAADKAFDVYDTLIDAEEGPGLSRELGRIITPMSTYTQWYWKIDLHNLLHFLSLRADPHAQYEIRVYAELILNIVRDWVPTIAEAFDDYKMGAHTFSRQEMDALRRMVAGFPRQAISDMIPEGLSKTELIAYKKALGVAE